MKRQWQLFVLLFGIFFLTHSVASYSFVSHSKKTGHRFIPASKVVKETAGVSFVALQALKLKPKPVSVRPQVGETTNPHRLYFPQSRQAHTRTTIDFVVVKPVFVVPSSLAP